MFILAQYGKGYKGGIMQLGVLDHSMDVHN